jgi:DNA-directed RNA polymerase specialized sigma24 family protein
MSVTEAFTDLTTPLRGGLLAHRYRMVGATDEAEDLVQETYLAAGRQDPATPVAARAGIRLAFAAALQHLSARRRAVPILRAVLDRSAAETAVLPGTTIIFDCG